MKHHRIPHVGRPYVVPKNLLEIPHLERGRRNDPTSTPWYIPQSDMPTSGWAAQIDPPQHRQETDPLRLHVAPARLQIRICLHLLRPASGLRAMAHPIGRRLCLLASSATFRGSVVLLHPSLFPTRSYAVIGPISASGRWCRIRGGGTSTRSRNPARRASRGTPSDRLRRISDTRPPVAL